ncbi:hypothetical protein [Archangium lipolyticum]|uniref:hypothetical protein n=1 Tax=Archangium lipolyticum TaxID=2970465 RepID=UPI002149AC6A|nr:hypothetical protein [Archangium lipolyticum]
MSIDIVVPVAPKDVSKLPSCLRGIVRHSRTAIRRIYVLSEQAPVVEPLPGGIPVHHAPESWFPFTKQDISRVLAARGCPYPSGGWYYQQLLKLYVFRAIPGLLPEVLILDSDYVFLQDVPFLSEDGRALLAMGYPFTWLLGTRRYPSTVEHVHAEFARRFVPGWSHQHPFSGMQHHMLFQADILEELLSLAERAHGLPAWRAFMKQVSVEKWNAASEYVLYHHFALGRHPERVALRHLRASDIIHDADDARGGQAHFDRLMARGDLQAAGCHAFLGLRERLETMDYIPPRLRTRMLAADSLVYALHLEEGLLQLECVGELVRRVG